MKSTVSKVNFNKYDEDIISVISSNIRYFSDADKANNLIKKWEERSVRNDAAVEVIEVE